MIRILLLLLTLSFGLQAQKVVVFKLENISEVGDYFLASNLSNWQPADSSFRFTRKDNTYQLVLSLPLDTKIEYKITRGTWDKSECQANGYPISNREVTVRADTTVSLQIQAWADKVIKVPMTSERLIADTLHSDILGKKKEYWVYLPVSYADTSQSFPVIYLQDGQNLFDGYYTHNGQEWRVDETVDSLGALQKGNYIVVGIGSDLDRLSEYSPYPWRESREIKGKEYLQFLVEELVPHIEKSYRTTNKRAIGGSSMGALISLEAILKYPEVFHTAALFSMAQANVLPENSFVLNQVKEALTDGKPREVFIYYGGKEAESLGPFSKELFSVFSNFGTIRVVLKDNPNGKHEEKYWSAPFGWFLDYIDK
jgi:predicted alpha/beta superfamily hydrolase